MTEIAQLQAAAAAKGIANAQELIAAEFAEWDGLSQLEPVRMPRSPVVSQLKSDFRDLKKAAQSADRTSVLHIDSWYGLRFFHDEGFGGITLEVIDFDSEASAQSHFEKTVRQTRYAADSARINAEETGRIVLFTMGQKVITLESAWGPGLTLTDLEGLNPNPPKG